MSPESTAFVTGVCQSHGNDPHCLLDILLDVEGELGHVGSESVSLIAEALDLPRVEVEGVVTFYAFLHTEPRGKVVIRLCDDVIDQLRGADRVAEGMEKELGIRFGEDYVDVITEGTLIAPGTRVRVIKISANRVVVRKIE